MTTPSTTWRISPWAWIPISAAVIAESVSNALRAYGLGTHLEKFTVSVGEYSVSLAGAVLVLAAVAVSLSQARAAWLALMPGPWRQRVVAGAAGLLLLAVSVMAMSSHILEAERAKVGAEGSQSGNYDRTLAEYTSKKAELDKLSNVRPIDTVRAEMNAAPVPRNVFRRTAECTDVTRDDSFTACKPILDLRQEMGLAIRKRELEPEVTSLKLSLDGQTKPEVASTSEANVAWIWAWLMGFAVVFVATFGTVIWAREVSDTPAKPLKSQAGSDVTDVVTDGSDLKQVAPVATQLAGVTDTELQRLRQWYFDREAEVAEPTPQPPKPRKKAKRESRKDRVIQKIRAHTLKHGAPPAFSVVQSRHRLPKATASRYLAEAKRTLN